MTSMIHMRSSDFSPSQSKAARALLGWSQSDLAREAKIGVSTVADFERDHRDPQTANVEAMRAAFEGQGITFCAGGVLNGAVPSGATSALASSSGRKVFRFFTATDLIQWADRRDAQSKLPELIARLIRADLGHGPKIHFPSDESVQLGGWDGTCVAETGSEHVPAGPSGWEMGTQSARITAKATSDYRKRIEGPDGTELAATTFAFVTPRRWSRKGTWVRERKAEGKWRDVRAYDADDLLHWIEKHPGVGHWLAVLMGKVPEGIRQLEDVWDEWVRATKWPISTDLILADRDEEAARIHRWLLQPPDVLGIQAESTDEAIAFLRASLRQLPDEHRLAHETRCLVMTSPDEARKLADSISRLIIVVADPPPGLAQWLTDKGHHVYAAYGSDIGLPEDICELSRPLRESMESALINMMVRSSGPASADRRDSLQEHARRLADDSARSLTILRRLLAAGGAPSWAAVPHGRALLVALLAGAWDESKPQDVHVLERLYRGNHADLMAELAPLLAVADSPIRKIGTIWKIASPRDAWHLLAYQLTSADLDELETCALEVLKAPDPRFELDSEGREMAGIRGIVRAHSDELRAGIIQTLLLLSLFGHRIRSDATGPTRAERVVRSLLSSAEACRWWSLSEDLRLLAEVAPRTFLDAVEDSLAAPDAPVIVLLKEDTGLFARSYLSNLLWGLESLAWDPQHLGAVAHVLAGLAIHDQGERQIQNRPKNSLREIFLTLRPHTHASLEERLAALDGLREQESAVAWNLMLAIYPRGSMVSHPTARPRWRDMPATGAEKLTGPLLAHAAEELIKRLLQDVGVDVERWKALLELLPAIPIPLAREAVVGVLISVSGSIVDEGERSRLRAAVQRVVSHHRRFPAAPWVMPSPELDRLDQVVAALEPSDSVARATWILSQRTDIDIGALDERETSESTTRQTQDAALAEVIAEHGIDGLFKLAATVRVPRMVGVAVGTLPANETRDHQILTRGLSADATPSDRDLALGMVRQYLLARGAEYIQSLVRRAVAESWGTNAAPDILTELPPCRGTWDLAASLGPDIETAYWKRLFIYDIHEDAPGIAFAIEKLMAAGRMTEAVELAGNRVQDPNRGLRRVRAAAETDDPSAPRAIPSVNPYRTLPTEFLVRVLTQVASAPLVPSVGRNDMTMFQYYVTEILKFLDEAGEISRETLASLEWMYLPLLEYSDRLPHTLHDELARNPDFFVTVLSSLYRPEEDSGVKDSDPPDSEATGARAQRAFQLLRTWEQPPGRREDGSIDPATLMAWVQAARQVCAKAGRQAVGDLHIGEILARSPADSDGAWPAQAVRKVIEFTRSRDLERGFGNGIYNQRGVAGRTVTEGGRQERSLAQTHRNWSRSIAARSPRTAAVLERIAREYEAEARSNDEEVDREAWT
jgi:transcriptional regulator with XRE-family HTH domain